MPNLFAVLGASSAPGTNQYPALLDLDSASLGATLATALASGTAYTSITVGAATAATVLPSGAILVLSSGGNTQVLTVSTGVTLSTSANTTIDVNSFTATFAYPAATAVNYPNLAVPSHNLFLKASNSTWVDAGTRTATVVLSAVAVAGAANSGSPVSGTSSGAGYYTPDPHCTKMLVTLKVAYGSAISAAPTMNVFTSPDSGTSWDTDAYTNSSISYAVSTTKQATVALGDSVGAASILYFQVVNNDGTAADSITVTVTVQEVDG